MSSAASATPSKSTATATAATAASTAAKDSPSKVAKPLSGGANNKYKQLVKQLKQNIAKQETLEDEIDTIERTIYNKESIYLASTANIIRGFDSYVGSTGSHGHGHGHAAGGGTYSHLNNGTADPSRGSRGSPAGGAVGAGASAGGDARTAAAAAAAKIGVLDGNRVFSLSSAAFLRQVQEMDSEIRGTLFFSRS